MKQLNKCQRQLWGTGRKGDALAHRLGAHSGDISTAETGALNLKYFKSATYLHNYFAVITEQPRSFGKKLTF